MYYEKDGGVAHETFEYGGEPFHVEKYYYPTVQPESAYKPWSYDGLIAEWDKLGLEKHTYSEISTAGGYPLYHYVYNPGNRTNVFLLQAGVHGNEMDAKQELLKIAQMMVNGTSTWKYVKMLCKWVFIPCISPYGHEHSAMNVPYEEQQYGLNLNRNYDYYQQWALESSGVGGRYPFEYAELRHVKYVADTYKPKTAIDLHDGGGVNEHLWISYQGDSPYSEDIDGVIDHLLEEFDISKDDAIIPHCYDLSSSTGVAAHYYGKTLGVPASVCEWIGGILGYDFKSDMMTKSIAVRGNLIRTYAYGQYDYEPRKEAGLWVWDFAPSATCNGLRPTTASYSETLDEIYDKWDELGAVKSTSYGLNTDQSHDVYTYTIGRGQNKVLYIGGVMRWGGQWLHTLSSMYILLQAAVEGRFGDLLERFTFIVCPAIDLGGGNYSSEGRLCGLNNSALTYKKVVNGILTSVAESARDYQILRAILQNHQDVSVILSGGEKMEGYSGNDQTKYTTGTPRISIPDDQQSILDNYYEDVTIEHTGGDTFGDYVCKENGIPTYYVDRYPDAEHLATLKSSVPAEKYLWENREVARTICMMLNICELYNTTP